MSRPTPARAAARLLPLLLAVIAVVLVVRTADGGPIGVAFFVGAAVLAVRGSAVLPAREALLESGRVVLLAAVIGGMLAVASPLPPRGGPLVAVALLQAVTVTPWLAVDRTLSRRAQRHRRWRHGALQALRVLTAVIALPLLMLSFATHRVPTTETNAPLGDTFALAGAGGTTLPATWLPAADPRGAVLLVHGLGADRQQFLPTCTPLRALGYAVLTFDQRDHGESGGITTTLGDLETDDCLAAWQELLARTRDLDGPRVVLAVSMGGVAALRAAPRLQHLDALILDSVPASIADIAADRLPFVGHAAVATMTALRLDVAIAGRPVLALAPVDHLSREGPPVLVLQGRADPLIPFANAERLTAALGARATLVAFAGEGHALSFLNEPERYRDAMRTFAERLPGDRARQDTARPRRRDR